jgi:hypothetical protein
MGSGIQNYLMWNSGKEEPGAKKAERRKRTKRNYGNTNLSI